MRFLVLCILFLGSFAHADKKKSAAKSPPSVVGRVVGIEIENDSVIATVAVGSEQGITKQAHVHFREGKTTKLLAGGEAVLIRVDRETVVVKTTLPADQVRANRFVQFDP